MPNTLRHVCGMLVPVPLVSKGESMTHEALRTCLTKTGTMLDPHNSLRSLLDRRVIKVAQVSQIANARAILADEAATAEFNSRPTCVDPFDMVLYKYDMQGNRMPEGPTLATGRATRLHFIPRPADTETKRKHYWIYSEVSDTRLMTQPNR
jgi:hypothetical protein